MRHHILSFDGKDRRRGDIHFLPAYRKRDTSDGKHDSEENDRTDQRENNARSGKQDRMSDDRHCLRRTDRTDGNIVADVIILPNRSKELLGCGDGAIPRIERRIRNGMDPKGGRAHW